MSNFPIDGTAVLRFKARIAVKNAPLRIRLSMATKAACRLQFRLAFRRLKFVPDTCWFIYNSGV